MIIILQARAQETGSIQEQFLEAEFFFMNEDYPDAIGTYLQLYEKMQENANLAYRIGVCYLNTDGKKNLSVEYLEKAVRNISAKHQHLTMQYMSSHGHIVLIICSKRLRKRLNVTLRPCCLMINKTGFSLITK
jgi:uncharacterized membrane protein